MRRFIYENRTPISVTGHWRILSYTYINSDYDIYGDRLYNQPLCLSLLGPFPRSLPCAHSLLVVR